MPNNRNDCLYGVKDLSAHGGVAVYVTASSHLVCYDGPAISRSRHLSTSTSPVVRGVVWTLMCSKESYDGHDYVAISLVLMLTLWPSCTTACLAPSSHCQTTVVWQWLFQSSEKTFSTVSCPSRCRFFGDGRPTHGSMTSVAKPNVAAVSLSVLPTVHRHKPRPGTLNDVVIVD